MRVEYHEGHTESKPPSLGDMIKRALQWLGTKLNMAPPVMFIDPEDAPPPIDLNKAADAVDAAEEINNTADTASADQEHAGADDTSGTYAPDRPLPRDENGRPIPDAD